MDIDDPTRKITPSNKMHLESTYSRLPKENEDLSYDMDKTA